MLSSEGGLAGRPPLVLVVDPVVISRHVLWRVLSRALGVLEAGSARSARSWLERRPDIDALVVEEDLPDEPGLNLVRELASRRHPIAGRAIVLTPRPIVGAGFACVPRGDLRRLLDELASRLLARDERTARVLRTEANLLARAPSARA